MKSVNLTLLFVCLVYLTKAQSFVVADLAPVLKSRANAVIRDSKTSIDMRSPDNVLMSITKAITIFNKNGDRYGQLALFYDKNISIKQVKGEIYDEFGKQISKFSLSNFRDESAINSFSLFEDSRVKYYTPQVNVYPYTIVYQYEIRNKQNLIIPEWKPVPGFDIAVENASYQFIHSPADEVRILAKNYEGKAEENVTEKQKSLLWKMTNVGAKKYEAYAPSPETYFPSIKIAPKNFSYYHFKGRYEDWAGLGKLTYDYLLKDRRTLPLETVQFIKTLTKDEVDDRAKAKKIYEYFQQKTRYISVQIGIGGFQPIKAAEVDQLGYGDCKALVNYMQSLLDVVGITSYYCVVEAGEDKTDLLPSFASMEQGNHVILCLPLAGDTTWLECTNQDAPFGYLGSFTDDRWVLACTKDGGKLLKTPKFKMSDSKQLRTGEFSLSKDGNMTGVFSTDFSGIQYDNHFSLLHKSEIEQERQLKHIYDINNIEFKSVSLKADKEAIQFTEKLSFVANRYGAVEHGRITFSPNLFNVKGNTPSVRNRQLPFELRRGYIDRDSISIRLEEGIIPVFLPKVMKVESKFGKYEASLKIEDGKLIYYRRLAMEDGLFAASDYELFEGFMNEVASNDRIRLTLALQ